MIKSNLNFIMKAYMITYCILMLVYCLINGPVAWGEYDDYTLPAVSIMREFNFGIDEQDILAYKEIFPEWATDIDNYSLSGYTTRGGSGEMAWYFPTYGIVCIPFILLLRFLKLPASYAFPIANIAFIFILLIMIYKCLNVNEAKKFAIIIALSINPIIFYLGWTSAEPLIFSLLGIAILCWYNGWYKRAAFFLSIAGTLNPTIMVIGIIMIFEYLTKLFMGRDKNISFIQFIRSKLVNIISYGSCYIVGIIPLIYNYYNTGYINLTASYDNFTRATESTFSRFIAYLFDLNYGFLPYYGLILILSLVLLLGAIIKKCWNYMKYMLAFFLNVYLYSMMVHINCGMSGMARYSTWASVILLLAVILFLDEIFNQKMLILFSRGFIASGICIVGIIIFKYGPCRASNLSWYFTPIATYILDKAPGLYNPLHSTFNARTNGLDGGYWYDTPIIYTNVEGEVKKILATAKDKETLLNRYSVITGDEQWFCDQVYALSEEEKYISVPAQYCIMKCMDYNLGENICFGKEGYNADNYAVAGLSEAESWGSWTDGHECKMLMRINDSKYERIHGHIEAGVYNESQHVIIYVNGDVVYDDIYTGNNLDFYFTNPHGICSINIELPDAINELAADGRNLGLSIGHMSLIGE